AEGPIDQPDPAAKKTDVWTRTASSAPQTARPSADPCPCVGGIGHANEPGLRPKEAKPVAARGTRDPVGGGLRDHSAFAAATRAAPLAAVSPGGGLAVDRTTG